MEEENTINKGQPESLLQKVRGFLAYDYYRTKLRWQGIWAMVYYGGIRPRLFWGLTVAGGLVFLGVDAFLITHFEPIFSSSDAITFFVSAGAASATVLAIAFSLQNLVIQNAAEHRSAGLYEEVGKDRTPTWVSIALSVITLAYFIMAIASPIYPDAIGKMLGVGVGLIAVVLWSIYFFYRHTFQELDPVMALVKIEKSLVGSIQEIGKIAKDASVVVRWQTRKDEGSKEMAEAAVFARMKPRFEEINRRLGYLYDYHDKLLASKERRSAKELLEVIKRVLQHYILLRSNSSLRIPVSLWGTSESDSQNFLSPNFDELLSKGKAYIKADDEAGSVAIVNVFRDLVLTASEVKFVNEKYNDNPIVSQCRGYFDELVSFGLKHMSREIVFQGTAAYGQMSAKALDKGHDIEFDCINDSLFKIGIKSVTDAEFDIVWTRVLGIYHALAKKLVDSDGTFKFEEQLRSIRDCWEPLIVFTSRALNNRARRSVLTLETDYLCMPINFLVMSVSQLSLRAEKESDKQKKRDLKRKFGIAVEQLYLLFRDLSEHLKSANSLLVKTIAEMSGHLGCLILSLSDQEEWKEEKDELINHAIGFACLPHYFIEHAEKFKTNMAFDSLVNTTTTMGIVALEKGQDKIAKYAIETVSSIATDMITGTKGSFYSFESSRVMAKACYIGLLAHKMGKAELVTLLKEKVAAFEKAWKEKYEKSVGSSDSVERVQHEVWGLRDEKLKYRHPYDISWILEEGKPAKRVLEHVDVIDIDRFSLEVWGSFVTPSPLDEELGLTKEKQKKEGDTKSPKPKPKKTVSEKK